MRDDVRRECKAPVDNRSMEQLALGGAGPAAGPGADQDLLGNLNPAQREAAMHHDGPLLVVAGAGSGKTAVQIGRAHV